MDYNKIFEQALQNLNPEQLEAVNETEGPVIVVAGPGTGKTQILALRIANIIKTTDVPPSAILALTFTDSGVNAMRDRLVSIIGPLAYEVRIHTFHSFCSSLISEFRDFFHNGQSLRPIDEITRYSLVRKLIEKNDYYPLVDIKNKFNFVPNIISQIGKLKKELVTPERLHDFALAKINELDSIDTTNFKKGVLGKHYSALKLNKKLLILSKIYKDYIDQMERDSWFDFDDMILMILDKFRNDPVFLVLVQERFQYFLLDEFQDTNNSQYEIINLLVSYYEKDPNLFVVGDDDQSIYRFQGASLENIHRFLEKYNSAKKIVLKTNYRSSQLILDAATSIISNNKDRVAENKQLLAANTVYPNNLIEIAKFNTHTEEFYFLSNRIKNLVDTGVSPSEIAVITRGNSELLKIAKFFDELNVNYTISANTNVLDNKYIKKVISGLRFLANPKDYVELINFLFLPNLDVKLTEIYALSALIKKNPKIPFVDIRKYFNTDSKIEITLIKLEKMIQLLNFESFSTFIRSLLIELGIFEDLIKKELLDDLNAVRSFIDFAESYFDSNSKPVLKDFLLLLDSIFEHNLKVNEKGAIQNSNYLNLMTAHKSKGLEFEYVFIPYATNKKWISSKRAEFIAIPDELFLELPVEESSEPEERRLFYVALTRAKHSVYISSALTYESGSEQIKAKFTEEISADFIVNLDIPELSFADLSKIFLGTGNEFKHGQEIKDWLRNSVIPNFKLSPSAFNDFLKCKRVFFYERILKLPTLKNMYLIEGSFIHLLVENLLVLKKKGQVMTQAHIDNIVDRYIDSNNLSLAELNYLKQNSLAIFTNWRAYHEQNNSIPDALYTELNFYSRDVFYDGVPLTGKIDLVEYLNTQERIVRVTDFKTSAPKTEGVIMGKTKDSDGAYYRQLMFYKLLIESDSNLRLKVDQGVLSYLIDKDGVYKAVPINYNPADYQEFKTQIKDVYNQIKDLSFVDSLHDECSCKGECRYIDYLN